MVVVFRRRVWRTLRLPSGFLAKAWPIFRGWRSIKSGLRRCAVAENVNSHVKNFVPAIPTQTCTSTKDPFSTRPKLAVDKKKCQSSISSRKFVLDPKLMLFWSKTCTSAKVRSKFIDAPNKQTHVAGTFQKKRILLLAVNFHKNPP